MPFTARVLPPIMAQIHEATGLTGGDIEDFKVDHIWPGEYAMARVFLKQSIPGLRRPVRVCCNILAYNDNMLSAEALPMGFAVFRPSTRDAGPLRRGELKPNRPRGRMCWVPARQEDATWPDALFALAVELWEPLLMETKEPEERDWCPMPAYLADAAIRWHARKAVAASKVRQPRG